MRFAEWFWFLEMERITHVGVESLLSGPHNRKIHWLPKRTKSHIRVLSGNMEAAFWTELDLKLCLFRPRDHYTLLNDWYPRPASCFGWKTETNTQAFQHDFTPKSPACSRLCFPLCRSFLLRDTIEGHFGWWARIPHSPSRGTSFFHSAAPHPAVTSSFLSTGSFPLASTSSSEFKTHMKQTALNHIVP